MKLNFGNWGKKKFSLRARAMSGASSVFANLSSLSSSAPIRGPQPILLPAHPGFIAFSLIMAFVFNLLPWGRALWVPDFVAMVLVFWNIHQPLRVGIGLAWLFGVLMDVHEAAVLGEHCLAYTLLSYSAITMHRRVLWFSLTSQALHVLPLFLLAQLVVYLVRLTTIGNTPGLFFFVESLTTTLLWAPLSLLLLAPQRRAVDKDVNRPI